jgi:hypothetical protein
MTLLQRFTFWSWRGQDRLEVTKFWKGRQAGTETSDDSDARRHRKKTGIIAGTFHNKSTAA